jgi:hypothetical protein
MAAADGVRIMPLRECNAGARLGPEGYDAADGDEGPDRTSYATGLFVSVRS